MSRIQEFDVNSRIKSSDGTAVDRSGNRSVERVRSAAVAPAPAAVSGDASDTVQITDSARALLTLHQALAEIPDIDVPKVERIRLAIDQQTYRVDAGRIADRLMQMDGDLAAAGTARRY